MNLLLVEPAEVSEGRVVVEGRRAQHLREVIGVTTGARIRTGIVGGGVGSAEVLADDGTRITLALAIDGPAPPPLPIELVLAVPRPKVLTRTIEAAASFGVERIALTNAWRVDKSYLSSPRLARDALAAAARLGAEQGATTHVPPIVVHRRLMELLDARWPAPRPGAGWPPAGPDNDMRIVAHPTGKPIENVARVESLVLAIGPEGGWIQRELDTFVARGFTPVSLGERVLRVETAVAAALGQLVMLRRLMER